MAHGHHVDHGGDGANKKIAIFITIIGLFLAVAETLAKGAQTNSIAYNVEASNLWSFYQAKTIRQTILKTASEQVEAELPAGGDTGTRQRLEKRINDWKAEVARYQSEPKADGKGEGRIELAERAKQAEKKRDVYTGKYHAYEIASAAFQIAIVMASVFLLTSTTILLRAAMGMCGVGGVALLVGLFAPGLLH